MEPIEKAALCFVLSICCDVISIVFLLTADGIASIDGDVTEVLRIVFASFIVFLIGTCFYFLSKSYRREAGE